ncbi:MAG: sensor histidine kinase [Gammaproteobacteria bacterium]
MPYRHNIRFRIFLSYPVLGLLVSIIVIVFFVFSFVQLEKQFLSDFLSEELNHFIALTNEQTDLVQQKAGRWAAYKVDNAHPLPDLLQPFRNYRQGIYDVFIDGRMYDIAVAEQGTACFYLIYDDADFEALEQSLLTYAIAGAFIIVWAATGYGIWFSKRVIKPVISLANQVGSLSSGSLQRPLVANYADDEIGFLAAEFDSYNRRIHDLLEREQAFTADASHELRTPLAVILAAAEVLLLRNDVSDDIKNRVRRIERSALAMKSRLEVLLILARTPGNEHAAGRTVELEPLIDQLLDEHAGLLPAAVRVVKKITGLPTISASPPLLSMALGNLIKNAFANTEAGTVTIAADDAGFTVSDTGKGIEKHRLERIFDRGYKDDSSQGQGLGLALVRRICEYHKWRLEVTSSPGKGSMFKLIF